MNHHYEKRGASVRFENGVLVLARERGEAWFEGETFRARPLAGRSDDAMPETASVEDVVARIRAAIPRSLAIERLVVVEGRAEHRLDGRIWSETSRRVHLSLANGRERMLLDAGDFDVEAFSEPIETFSAMEPSGEPPVELRLAPRVSAAVVPMFAAGAPPGVTLLQVGDVLDGDGLPLRQGPLSTPWPNVWRPSYRVRPMRVPVNMMARHANEATDRSLPEAVALLREASSPALRVLVRDGVRCWPAEVRVDRVRAIAAAQSWYPFHAGSFGGEMVL